MLNIIKSFIAAAVLSGTVSANVQAVPTNDHGETFWSLSYINQNVPLKQPIKPAALAKSQKAVTGPKAVTQVAKQTTATAPGKPAPKATPTPKPVVPKESPKPKQITVKATAYTASCEGCSGTTTTGIDLKANPDKKVIAVDPSVIPLGSKVYVEGYGEATAADTGGAIEGNRIDVFIPSEQEAINFGVKHVKVTIID